LDAPLTGTGAEEFDKKFPLPPPEYRLDACDMLRAVHDGLMYERVRWGSTNNVLTPGAAAILTAAVSAVLYQVHQRQMKMNAENEEEKEEGEKGATATEMTSIKRRES
jgi:hypothetical protein